MADGHDHEHDHDHDHEHEVITLIDEDGEEHVFELCQVLELGSERYAILIPEGNENENEAFVLRFDGEGDDMTLVTLDSDEEFDRVAEALALMEDDGLEMEQ